jgi:hypothetical protein
MHHVRDLASIAALSRPLVTPDSGGDVPDDTALLQPC